MRGIAVRSRTEEDTRDRGEVFFFVFLFLARSHGFRQPFLFSFHFVVCELKKKRRWNCFCASERVRDGRGMVPFVFCFSFLFQTESKSFLSGGIFAIVSLFCFFFYINSAWRETFSEFLGFFSCTNTNASSSSSSSSMSASAASATLTKRRNGRACAG